MKEFITLKDAFPALSTERRCKYARAHDQNGHDYFVMPDGSRAELTKGGGYNGVQWMVEKGALLMEVPGYAPACDIVPDIPCYSAGKLAEEQHDGGTVYFKMRDGTPAHIVKKVEWTSRWWVQSGCVFHKRKQGRPSLMSKTQRRRVFSLRKRGKTLKEISEKVGFSESHISLILRGKR